MTHPKTFGLIFIALCCLVVSACNDIIVPDIADEKLVVLAPLDGYSSEQQSVSFWWEELNQNDLTYRFDLVSPSFEAIENIAFREVIPAENTSITKTLLPGDYQWQIVAFNTRSETKSKIYNLSIASDSANELANQVITLVAPEEGAVINQTTVQFLWQELTGAEFYKIQVASPDFSNSTFMASDQETENDFIELNGLIEGEYLWRVRAENETSVTPYSTSSFAIDLTAPQAPVLLNPSFEDSLSLPILLSWQNDSDVAYDSLFVYNDSLQNSLILAEKVEGSSLTLNGIAVEETYYWKVGSTDFAGNLGSFSSLGKFFVIE